MTEETKTRIGKDLDEVIAYYNTSMAALFNETKPGIVRARKGEIVETLAKKLLMITWTQVLGADAARLDQNQNKLDVRIKDEANYLNRLHDDAVKEDIRTNQARYIYKFSTDVHVFIDGELAIAIECKSYTETAMLKRIIFDSMLMDEALPHATHFLFELEKAFSHPYHVLMSHHSHNIEVITLLDGRRNAQKPIHREENFRDKPLKKERLIVAIEKFEAALKDWV